MIIRRVPFDKLSLTWEPNDKRYYLPLPLMPEFAWTGGTSEFKVSELKYRLLFLALRRFYFREQLRSCGGLDLWACSGTSSFERARIFWNRATLDAYATLDGNNLL